MGPALWLRRRRMDRRSLDRSLDPVLTARQIVGAVERRVVHQPLRNATGHRRALHYTGPRDSGLAYPTRAEATNEQNAKDTYYGCVLTWELCCLHKCLQISGLLAIHKCRCFL